MISKETKYTIKILLVILQVSTPTNAIAVSLALPVTNPACLNLSIVNLSAAAVVKIGVIASLSVVSLHSTFLSVQSVPLIVIPAVILSTLAIQRIFSI